MDRAAGLIDYARAAFGPLPLLLQGRARRPGNPLRSLTKAAAVERDNAELRRNRIIRTRNEFNGR
ncbi:hypothetical protein BURKHO8Y_10425 [Burkholderia sp. 8Y]|nr:hypothetical protein BURKHO8Y_10425 [Burkholderia sp. 8Y]